MKATTKRVTSAMDTALAQLPKRCNDCRGTGGVYINEDLQVEFDVCLKCNGYGWIYE